MGGVVVLGEAVRAAGFALAGATVIAAEDAAAVRDAWAALPGGTAVVVLTPAAAAALGELVRQRPDVLTVAMPA